MIKRFMKCLPFLSLSFLVCTVQPAVAAQRSSDSYLPLFEKVKWVLRNPRQAVPFVFEVVRRDSDGYRIVSTNPWGSSEWTLTENNGVFQMTRYGAGGNTMPLTDKPVYLDFKRAAGDKWSNSLGSLEVVSRSAVVKTASRTYTDCIQIRHNPKGASMLYTFARGVGFVSFGEGAMAFVLDESASVLPGGTKTVVTTSRTTTPLPTTPTPGGRIRFGLTPNRLATEPNSPEVLVLRFHQTVDMGVSFVVGNATWKELEPSEGRYSLDNLNYLVSSAAGSGLPVSYTLRVIDTTHKNTPPDLRNVAWNDSKMKTRVLRLMEAMVPAFRGQVRWFMFGYEIDAYIRAHPGEASAFAELQKAAATRLKELVPGMQVSTTITFTGIDELAGRLSRLNAQSDFLALTYCPIEPGFTVKDPSVLPADFVRMKQVAAGRKIVLQEIAYPTSPLTNGSEQKQSDFYQLAFDQFARDDGTFEAVNFMMLADLSDADADGFASFYGMTGARTFRALLQTLGMHDVHGKPKKAWDVFRKNIIYPAK